MEADRYCTDSVVRDVVRIATNKCIEALSGELAAKAETAVRKSLDSYAIENVQIQVSEKLRKVVSDSLKSVAHEIASSR